MSTNAVRFRRSSAITVAAIIVAIAGLSLVTWAPPYALIVLVIPLAVALWSWRAGTDVDADGVTVRAALGRRRIPWSDVTGLVTEGRGQVSAYLTSGQAITLPAVTAADVPRLIAASGQELRSDDVTDPR
jgi:hypothetical protein